MDGTAYTYKIHAVSSGVPVLDSLDSPTVSVTADATAPGQATSITLANGGGNGGAYVNAANASSISLSVALPAGSLTTDVVQLTATLGGTVTTTRAGSAGAGTVTFNGINVSGLGDGTLTVSVISTDLAGNVSTVRTATFTKDTVAPGAPTAVYTDNNNVADVVSGTAQANASITVTKTAPAPTAAYPTTADGAGAYTVTVAAVNGKPNPAIPVTYTITATDAAGNTSAVDDPELQRHEVMREADMVMDEFVALISHELRTPLTSIIGYLELTLDDANLTEEQRGYLDVVDHNAARLLRLVDDMLFVAQIAAGQLEVRPSELDLAAIVRQAVSEAQRARSSERHHAHV